MAMELQTTHTYKSQAGAVVPWGPRAVGRQAGVAAMGLAALLVLAVLVISAIGRMSAGAGTEVTVPGQAEASAYSLAQLGIRDGLVELSHSANPVAWAGRPTMADPNTSRGGQVAYWATPATCGGISGCEAAWSVFARANVDGAKFTVSGRVLVQATNASSAFRFDYQSTTP
jgi:hypothetical protein